MNTLLNWLPTAVLLLAFFAVYLGREGLKTWVNSGVQHGFHVKLETLRDELRSNEQSLSALRQGALAGAFKRRELLEQRKLQAIENLWAATVDLQNLKSASMTMQHINFEKAAVRTPNETKLREFFEMLAKPYDVDKISSSLGATERPYVSEKAWALFSAYYATLRYAVLQLKMLELGITDAEKMISSKYIADLASVALPHREELLQANGALACHQLVDELEEAVFVELRRNLAESNTSEEDVKIAARILTISNAMLNEVTTPATKTSHRASAK